MLQTVGERTFVQFATAFLATDGRGSPDRCEHGVPSHVSAAGLGLACTGVVRGSRLAMNVVLKSRGRAGVSRRVQPQGRMARVALYAVGSVFVEGPTAESKVKTSVQYRTT